MKWQIEETIVMRLEVNDLTSKKYWTVEEYGLPIFSVTVREESGVLIPYTGSVQRHLLSLDGKDLVSSCSTDSLSFT